MQNEFQAAYELSSLGTDYNPDRERIRLLRKLGYFVVVADSLAYCRFTDATLRNPVRRLAWLDYHVKPASFQTQQRAEAFIEQLYAADEGDGETNYAVLAPEQTDCDWLVSVANFIAELNGLDERDAVKWVRRSQDTLAGLRAMFNDGVIPAEAAAQFLRDRKADGFDYTAWFREQMLYRPTHAQRPVPPIVMEDEVPF